MRSLALAVLCLFTVSLHADKAALWAQYNSLKSNQFTSLTLTAENHVAMAKVAGQLGRNDIRAWDYNDAAFDLINQFKGVTNYVSATAKISADSREQRKTDRVAFRVVLQNNIAILDSASISLDEASKYATKSDVKKAIASNKSFIRWVKNFVK